MASFSLRLAARLSLVLCLFSLTIQSLATSSAPLLPHESNAPTSFSSLRKLTKPGTTLHRVLNQEDDDFTSLLVDANGNDYEPYSLAWRYLGMYLDCDAPSYRSYSNYNHYNNNGDNNNNNNGQATSGSYYRVDDDDDDVDVEDLTDWYRRRLSGSGDDGVNCTRKVLWAAYHDPRYRGNQIGEYQFYDFDTGEYSNEFCANTNPITGRCVRMDCHEPNTHFKLVGIYKENDGLLDWAEQLFKHQGVCLWGEDEYEFMQQYQSFWPSYCRQLYYSGEDGSTLYMDLRPTPEGNITVGIYSDEVCMTPSYYTFADYIYLYYSYYGYYDKAEEVVATWNSAIEQWNSYMNIYKICQPCRAYSLNVDRNGGDSGSQSGSESNEEDNNNQRRFLGEENDGEGDEEISGYNCYDDAGYTNCNQCYKFETQTDMEEAGLEDLKRADKQGTILEIRVNGHSYGKGLPFCGPPKVDFVRVIAVLFFVVAFMVFIFSIVYLFCLAPISDRCSKSCQNKSKLLGTLLHWMKEKWMSWQRKRPEIEWITEDQCEKKDTCDGLYLPPESFLALGHVPVETESFNGGTTTSFHTAITSADEDLGRMENTLGIDLPPSNNAQRFEYTEESYGNGAQPFADAIASTHSRTSSCDIEASSIPRSRQHL